MELVSKDSVIKILKKRTKAKAIKEIMALPSAGWHHGDPDESVAAIVERSLSSHNARIPPPLQAVG